MITTRRQLIDAIGSYVTQFPEEENFREKFLSLLNSEGCFQRDHLPGHITGSAFIIDKSRKFTLLTHHAKLNKWLQPGGHADGDENISGVALREAMEETGLKNFSALQNGIFDIDIHLIPARNNFPEHFHYDVRILLGASRDEGLTITEESHDLAWLSLHDIGSMTGNHSLVRMMKKTIQ
jgi:8-oxo-dGTP pyrophosphatase MutT (NUDIX family)